MTNEEAKVNLEKLLQIYDDPGIIDFTVIVESIKMALEALKRQESAIRMLNMEERDGTKWHSREYSNGRISAFYDALGINYTD